MSNMILDDALNYLNRGWPPVPMKGKKALAKWGELAHKPPTEHEVRHWFAKSSVQALAVLAVNGLAIRDFDSVPSYLKWKESHPALAATLPTVQTRRGYHVWCESDHPHVVTLGDGEFRGAGLTIAPRSLRSDGGVYRWVIPLPKGRLPFVEHQTFTGTHVTECTEAICSVSSVHSVHSVTSAPASSPSSSQRALPPSSLPLSSPSEVSAYTLPTKPGERNACILNLARGLKFNAGMAGAGKDDLREIVRNWHKTAVAIIGTKAFDETWADFIHAFDAARHPLGINFVDVAADRVDPEDLPDVAANYESESTRRLIGLCRALATMNGSNGMFFLSAHDVAPRLNVTPMQAWRLLRMLCSDGVLELVDRGNERKAGRYRYVEAPR